MGAAPLSKPAAVPETHDRSLFDTRHSKGDCSKKHEKHDHYHRYHVSSNSTQQPKGDDDNGSLSSQAKNHSNSLGVIFADFVDGTSKIANMQADDCNKTCETMAGLSPELFADSTKIQHQTRPTTQEATPSSASKRALTAMHSMDDGGIDHLVQQQNHLNLPILVQLILIKEWQLILERINLYPWEVSQSVIIYLYNLQRPLVLHPLHLLCAFDPPEKLIEVCLLLYSKAAELPVGVAQISSNKREELITEKTSKAQNIIEATANKTVRSKNKLLHQIGGNNSNHDNDENIPYNKVRGITIKYCKNKHKHNKRKKIAGDFFCTLRVAPKIINRNKQIKRFSSVKSAGIHQLLGDGLICSDANDRSYKSYYKWDIDLESKTHNISLDATHTHPVTTTKEPTSNNKNGDGTILKNVRNICRNPKVDIVSTMSFSSDERSSSSNSNSHVATLSPATIQTRLSSSPTSCFLPVPTTWDSSFGLPPKTILSPSEESYNVEHLNTSLYPLMERRNKKSDYETISRMNTHTHNNNHIDNDDTCNSTSKFTVMSSNAKYFTSLLKNELEQQSENSKLLLLPIHIACLYQASPGVISRLIKVYPSCVSVAIIGMLPIHIVSAGWSTSPWIADGRNTRKDGMTKSKNTTVANLFKNANVQEGNTNFSSHCLYDGHKNGVVKISHDRLVEILRIFKRASPGSLYIRSTIGKKVSAGKVPIEHFIEWNVKDIFLRRECEKILKIPLRAREIIQHERVMKDRKQFSSPGNQNLAALLQDENKSFDFWNTAFGNEELCGGIPCEVIVRRNQNKFATSKEKPFIQILLEKKDWKGAVELLEERPFYARKWLYGAARSRNSVVYNEDKSTKHNTSSGGVKEKNSLSERKVVSWKWLPIHLACDLGAPVGLIDALILAYPRGASCAESQTGSLPLHIACSKCSYNRVNNVRVKTLKDDLSTKASAQSYKIVKKLLTVCGVTTKAVDRYGRLPLHCAAIADAPYLIIEMLIKEDPDSVLAMDKENLRPIDYAFSIARFRCSNTSRANRSTNQFDLMDAIMKYNHKREIYNYNNQMAIKLIEVVSNFLRPYYLRGRGPNALIINCTNKILQN